MSTNLLMYQNIAPKLVKTFLFVVIKYVTTYTVVYKIVYEIKNTTPHPFFCENSVPSKERKQNKTTILFPML